MLKQKFALLRSKINLWIGGEQLSPKIDYFSLQSDDKQLNLSAREFSSRRVNKLWKISFVVVLIRIFLLLLFYFLVKKDNMLKFNLILNAYFTIILLAWVFMVKKPSLEGYTTLLSVPYFIGVAIIYMLFSKDYVF